MRSIGERQALVHVQIKPALGVDVSVEQRTQRPEIFLRQPPGPRGWPKAEAPGSVPYGIGRCGRGGRRPGTRRRLAPSWRATYAAASSSIPAGAGKRSSRAKNLTRTARPRRADPSRLPERRACSSGPSVQASSISSGVRRRLRFRASTCNSLILRRDLALRSATFGDPNRGRLGVRRGVGEQPVALRRRGVGVLVGHPLERPDCRRGRAAHGAPGCG